MEQQPVGESRQPVVESPVLQLTLQPALPGHVSQREHHAADRAVVPQIAVSAFELNRCPVAARDPPVLGVLRLVVAHPLERGHDVIALLLPDEVPQVRSFYADVTENGLGRRGGVTDLPVVVNDQDDVRGIVHEGPEVLLVVAPVHLQIQQHPLNRQRDLAGQDLEGPGQRHQASLVAEHGQHPDQRIAGRAVLERERAEQGTIRHGQVLGDLLTQLAGPDELRLRSSEQ